MHERVAGMAQRTRWVVGVGMALAVVLAAVWLIAADPKSEPAVIDDCFGGALSQDPLHCAVLELAHNEGIMEVDAVYRAGTSLYLYLAQSESVSDEVYDYIRDKAREEVARGGGRACKYLGNGCDRGIMRMLLPPSAVYGDIELRTGGADGRRSHGGWAAYRQLWPVVSGGTRGDSSGTTGTGTFDVSGVDTTNFPEFKSGWPEPLDAIGIVGWNTGGGLWVQVKAPPGQEAKATAAKEVLFQSNSRLNEDNLVIIPVKYSYEEYWRWSMILDRFAVARGNTVGILWSRVAENFEVYITEGGEAVYPLPEVPEAVPRPELGVTHPEDYRTTLNVMTYELQRTVDALPVLLPLLGIPVDAVGVVVEYRPGPKYVDVPAVSSPAEPVQSEAVPGATESDSNAETTDAVTESASDSGDDAAAVITPAEPAISEAAPEATESVSEDVDEAAPAPVVVEPAVSEQGFSPWLLVGGAVAIAAFGAVLLIGLRIAGRRV